ATIPEHGHKQYGNVQMWSSGRFVAMTGWHLPETPRTIAARQSQLDIVHAAYIEKPRAEDAAAHARDHSATHTHPPRALNAGQGTGHYRSAHPCRGSRGVCSR